jgi:hypothetical protein
MWHPSYMTPTHLARPTLCGGHADVPGRDCCVDWRSCVGRSVAAAANVNTGRQGVESISDASLQSFLGTGILELIK